MNSGATKTEKGKKGKLGLKTVCQAQDPTVAERRWVRKVAGNDREQDCGKGEKTARPSKQYQSKRKIAEKES